MKCTPGAVLFLLVQKAAGNQVSHKNRAGVTVTEAHSLSGSADCGDPAYHGDGVLCSANMNLAGAFHDTTEMDEDNAEFGEVIDVDIGGMSAQLTAKRVSEGFLYAEGAHGEELSAVKRDGRVFGTINGGGMICNFADQEEDTDHAQWDCTPQDQFPPEADAVVAEDEMQARDLRGRRAQAFPGPLADPNDHSIAYFDVLIIYTQNAMCAAAGLDYPCNTTADANTNILGVLDLAVQETNTGYSESQIDAEMRLVHAHLDPTFDDTTLSMSATLNALKAGTNGFDYVSDMRDIYGADFVALITAQSSYCGIAHLGHLSPQHTSVTKWTCATGYYSFAHEIGHNMGCYHNREQGTSAGNDIGYGYNGELNDNNGIRSILSYAPGTRILRFSNPDITFENKTIGSATSNNAKWIQDRRHVFAAFKDSGPPTVSPAPTVSQEPTLAPTTAHPTLSKSPSAQPTLSQAPSTHPSNGPTFPPTLPTLKLRTPESNSFQIQNGNMFDIVAKQNILIHNLEVTLYTSTVVTVELFTKQGTFVDDIRNETAWTLTASAPGMKGTGCLDDTMPLPRGAIADPISVSAGSTLGMYLRVVGSNYIGMDNTRTSGFSQDGNYGTVVENRDIVITEGVYKSRWDHHSGSPYEAFRFAGWVYYTIDGTRPPTTAPSASPSAPTAAPSLVPTSGATTARSVIRPPDSNSFYVTAGVMFDMKASAHVEINNLDVNLWKQGPAANVEIYSRIGSHADVSTDISQWDHVATVHGVWGTGNHDTFTKLPPKSFDPLPINAGETRAFYVHVQNQNSAENKMLVDGSGKSYNCEAGHYFGDTAVSVCGGLRKNDWSTSSGGGSTHYGYQGAVYYTVLGTSAPITSAPTQAPTTAAPTTSAPTKAPTTSAPTQAVTTGTPTTSAPTKAPTTSPPTQAPTTSAPTQAPTTSAPTQAPTTAAPTTSAPTTSAPTQAPTTASPTPPPTAAVKTLAGPSYNSNYIVRSQYFQVDVKDSAMVLTDLAITTYKYSNPGRVRVYGHAGPCSDVLGSSEMFTLIADTVAPFQSGVQPNGYIQYGKESYPDWSFSSQVLPAGSSYCVYMHNEGGYFFVPNDGFTTLWVPAFQNTDLALCTGRFSGNTNLWSTSLSSTVGRLRGEISYTDLGPTASPSAAPSMSPSISNAPSISAAPTTVYSPARVVSQGFLSGGLYSSRGVMFDILSTRDTEINGIRIHFYYANMYDVEIWTRVGSHVDNKNNWDGGWTNRFNGQVRGGGYKKFTDLIQIQTFQVPAGVKCSIAIITPRTTHQYIYQGTQNKNAVSTSNEDLYVFEASYLNDYYSNMVGPTASSFSSYSRTVPVEIDYVVRNNGNYVPYTPADIYIEEPGDLEPDEEPVCEEDCDSIGGNELMMSDTFDDELMMSDTFDEGLETVPDYDDKYRFVLEGVEFGCADISTNTIAFCGLVHDGVKVSDACPDACAMYEDAA